MTAETFARANGTGTERPRVLVAGLYHESHSFMPGATPLSQCQLLQGEELLRCEGDLSTLGAALHEARRLGWDVVPAVDLKAAPSAVVEDQVVELWWQLFREAAQAQLRGGLDAVFLCLHGAMVSQSLLDVEGEMLARIRALVGPEVRIGGVTDLHANFSPRMAQNSDLLVTYRKNPHTDAGETTRRAVGLLDRILGLDRPPLHLSRSVPLMLPPTGTGTADQPMHALEAQARRIEAEEPEVLCVNAHAGYSFADTPFTGVSFSIVTLGNAAAAEVRLGTLEELALALKDEGTSVPPGLETVMPRVLAWNAAPRSGPLVLVEPADNIGGGAPGDDTAVLRALLRHGVQNAAVVIADPAAVATLESRAPGEKCSLWLGGKGSPLGAGPLQLEVELVSQSDGTFDLEDSQSHIAARMGRHIRMGRCATVRCEGVKILITSVPTPPADLGQLRSQGIVPEEMSVIGVKAAIAHRRAYDKICGESITVTTAGPCTSNLALLPFQHIPPGTYPLS